MKVIGYFNHYRGLPVRGRWRTDARLSSWDGKLRVLGIGRRILKEFFYCNLINICYIFYAMK
jgi:hypothetical protein